jgi:nucleoside-diphosphate-sugar epimerase
MKILVTGDKGYIGAVMVPMLLAAGHAVAGFDSDYYEGCTFGEGMAEIPSLRKDVRDVEREDLVGFDAVIHLAALSNDPISNLNPQLTYEINHQASVRLAQKAKAAGVPRYLFSSSCSLYGAAGDTVLTEEAAFNPVTAYGETKVLVERDVAQLAGDDFSPTFLRNSTAYGVSPRLRFDIVLNDLVALAYTTGVIFLKSDGTPWRPLIHVEDIGRAFLAVLNAPREKVHNQAFNVGQSAENYRIRDLAEIVRDVVPGCRIEYAPDAGPDKRSYRVDFGKLARTLPEFKPQWNARLGAQQLYDAYRRFDLPREEVGSSKYRRINRIKELLARGRLDASLRWVEQLVPQR